MIAPPGETDHLGWVTQILAEEPHLLDKVRASQSVGEADAMALLTETLRFLHLIAFYNRRLTPSLPVDLAWHECILFTRWYARFCQDKFGRFIHHHPGGKESENQRNFHKTIQLYIIHWGQPHEKVWGHQAAALYEEAQCGSCLGDTNPS